MPAKPFRPGNDAVKKLNFIFQNQNLNHVYSFINLTSTLITLVKVAGLR